MEIKQDQWRFPASNGEGDIFAHAWLPEKPIAIVQIAHGMSEHSARYDEFARFLCLHGFSVVANDHAGHGQSAQGHLGAFATKAGGFDCSVEDMHRLFLHAEEKIGKLPSIIFGHSMGSILAALYAERWGELTALVLSGTPAAIKFSRLCSLIADCICAARGHHARSPLLERLTGSVANLPPEEKERKGAWLSRDIEKIREFNNDPLCGFDYSAGGYSAILHAYHYMNSNKWGWRTPDIPILVVAGTDDTASNTGKGPAKYATRLTKTGHTHVELKLFPECRHEIVNELNRQEIYAFLCNWFTDKLQMTTK
jgi:alpha-beta hydrolase superfamily lysophospholipase